jgi:hypothetical protein
MLGPKQVRSARGRDADRAPHSGRSNPCQAGRKRLSPARVRFPPRAAACSSLPTCRTTSPRRAASLRSVRSRGLRARTLLDTPRRRSSSTRIGDATTAVWFAHVWFRPGDRRAYFRFTWSTTLTLCVIAPEAPVMVSVYDPCFVVGVVATVSVDSFDDEVTELAVSDTVPPTPFLLLRDLPNHPGRLRFRRCCYTGVGRRDRRGCAISRLVAGCQGARTHESRSGGNLARFDSRRLHNGHCAPWCAAAGGSWLMRCASFDTGVRVRTSGTRPPACSHAPRSRR